MQKIKLIFFNHWLYFPLCFYLNCLSVFR
jgi:hypothetical protein